MKKSKYSKTTFDKIKTVSIYDRPSKISNNQISQTLNKNNSLEQYLSALPDILSGGDFKEFIKLARNTIKQKKPLVIMMGAHSIKCGLSPHIIQLIKNGYVSHLAMNGACAIHDIELSMWGKTSEDVGVALKDGSFGMCKETADFINLAINENKDNDLGYGECIGEKLQNKKAKDKSISLINACMESNVPFSIHSALGTEIIHQHPSLDGASYGEKSLLDFQLFTNSLTNLTKDSMVINIGSAVIMPEIFLKALTIVRNLGHKAYGFHTAVFDMIRHYRPSENIQRRPTQDNRRGFYFIGHFEIMLPLVCGLLNDEKS